MFHCRQGCKIPDAMWHDLHPMLIIHGNKKGMVNGKVQNLSRYL